MYGRSRLRSRPLYLRAPVAGADVRSTLRRPAAKAGWSRSVVVAPRGRFVPSTHRPSTVVVRNGTCPLPDILYTTFVVQGNATLTTDGAGGVASATILVNSMFDPLGTAGGQQPRYYDQLVTSTLYGRYTVMSTKVTVRALGIPSVGPNVPTRCLVNFTPNNTNTFTDPYADSEVPNSMFFDINNGMDHFPVRSMLVQVPGIVGRTMTQLLADEDYGGSNATNPARIVYGYINFRAPGESGATILNVGVRMEFRVRLSNLATPASS